MVVGLLFFRVKPVYALGNKKSKKKANLRVALISYDTAGEVRLFY